MVQAECQATYEENVLLLTNPGTSLARLLTEKSNETTDSVAWGDLRHSKTPRDLVRGGEA